MSSDSNYSSYGFEWVLDDIDREQGLFIVIPHSQRTGIVELTEQDLRDMLSAIESTKD